MTEGQARDPRRGRGFALTDADAVRVAALEGAVWHVFQVAAARGADELLDRLTDTLGRVGLGRN